MRLIDADAFDTILENGEIEAKKQRRYVFASALNTVRGNLAKQSSVSSQPEIIRCKDCENWDTTWQNDWPKNYHYCPLIDGIRNGDWYCADAERRTDERSDRQTGGN